MDELIKAMSSEDLAGLKDKYKDNASVVLLIDGILESRAKEEEQAKAKAKFEHGISKLFASLPHPEDVYNVYARWGEVEVDNGEPEEVEVVDTFGGKAIELRTPKVKVYQWVVEVNHATRMASGGGDGKPKATKRAITVFKREGTTLLPKGNYPSASKACEALGLVIGGDSATRVLSRDGYITEAYDGVDFTS